MVNIAELIKRITDFINSKDEELSKKELKKAISDIYDALNKPEKKTRKSKKDIDSSDEKTEKKKRPPTAYNLFMREQMAKLKESESDDDKMTAKAKMEFIANLWKQKKESESEKEEEEVKKDEEEEKKDDNEEKKEDKKKRGGAPRKALGKKKDTEV